MFVIIASHNLSMKKLLPAIILLVVYVASDGCYVGRQAILVSPFNGNNSVYHTIPLKSDSIRSAFFISASFATGQANYTSDSRPDTSVPGADYVKTFQFNIYRTHNAGVLELYYGGHFALGNYTLNKFDSIDNDPSVNYQAINQYAGRKLFGGYGADAGLDIILPIGGGGEWRVLGYEFSLTHEFGKYLQFRNQIPFSYLTYVAPSNFYGNDGFFTEIMMFKGAIGLKLEKGWVMGSQYNNLQIMDNSTQQLLQYHYFTMTLSGIIKKFTVYLQLNSATMASGLQFGVNYRIAKKKIPAPH
jgi:hypothetical protein